jgi:hypothetical protein
MDEQWIDTKHIMTINNKQIYEFYEKNNLDFEQINLKFVQISEHITQTVNFINSNQILVILLFNFMLLSPIILFYSVYYFSFIASTIIACSIVALSATLFFYLFLNFLSFLSYLLYLSPHDKYGILFEYKSSTNS